MIPVSLLPLAHHVWQSTLFAAAIFLLTLALRKHRAQTRHALWLTASVKFLIPFSLLVSAGRIVEWHPVPRSASHAAFQQVTATVLATADRVMPMVQVPELLTPAPRTSVLPLLLFAVWGLGALAILLSWTMRWLRVRRMVLAAETLEMEAPIPVLSTSEAMEPGVFGIFRPVLLLPRGIAAHLSPEQWRAILAHELCHVRRRDNLAAALHMLVEALFWFHPLVWWIGSRLIEERERACDEEVLRHGNEPLAYAEGILTVCKFCLESPLPCASGVSGADLRKRVEQIMADRVGVRLSPMGKMVLATLAAVAVLLPLTVGVMRPLRAQGQIPLSTAKAFDVVSVKPSAPDQRGISIRLAPGGGINVTNATVRVLVGFAYNVTEARVSGPSWIDELHFDVQGKNLSAPAEMPDPRQMTDAQRRELEEGVRMRTRAILQDRFQLGVHTESKEGPVYLLVPAKSGVKLKESAQEEEGPQLRAGRGSVIGQKVSMDMITRHLSQWTGRPVLDKTGLTGKYSFELTFTPESGAAREPGTPSPAMGAVRLGGGPGGPGAPGGGPGGPGPGGAGPGGAELTGPSLFSALQEQLGLKLEPSKAPVETIVIDKVEKPSAN